MLASLQLGCETALITLYLYARGSRGPLHIKLNSCVHTCVCDKLDYYQMVFWASPSRPNEPCSLYWTYIKVLRILTLVFWQAQIRHWTSADHTSMSLIWDNRHTLVIPLPFNMMNAASIHCGQHLRRMTLLTSWPRDHLVVISWSPENGIHIECMVYQGSSVPFWLHSVVFFCILS